jgi:hypothetical protein
MRETFQWRRAGRPGPRRNVKATFLTNGPQLRFLTSSAISLRGGSAARIGASLSFLPTIIEMFEAHAVQGPHAGEGFA